MAEINIKKYFEKKAVLVNKALDNYLPSEKDYPPVIHTALRYSVLNGGKRFRPILAIATAEMLGGSVKDVLPCACAIELIHCYSLVHDDLPCMDNDDFRRGRPTTHRQFGEPTAILAGNALVTVAFEIMCNSSSKTSRQNGRLHKVMVEIGIAAGMQGMVVGQAADLESENKNISKEMLAYIHAHKTGALIMSSVRVGALVSHATPNQLKRLTDYGKKLGLLFQITDDILDIESTQEKRGKKIGGDIERGKATYPKLHGMKKAKQLVTDLVKGCYKDLKPFGKKADTLKAIVDYIAQRRA